jgi:hypothetical protein
MTADVTLPGLPARKGFSRPEQRAANDPVQVYRQPIPFRCSAGCGESIRWGQEFVQTCRKPLERAHRACAGKAAAA